MFRVDPEYKRTSIAFATAGKILEDYDFLQLTKARAVWILHASSAQDPDEPTPDRRYMFANLLSALELGSDARWVQASLTVMLPESMNSSRRLVTSAVTEVWLCKITKGDDDLCFEVATESAGVHFLTTTGSKSRKSRRTDLFWPRPLEERARDRNRPGS